MKSVKSILDMDLIQVDWKNIINIININGISGQNESKENSEDLNFLFI